jgi:hypothetical protein
MTTKLLIAHEAYTIEEYASLPSNAAVLLSDHVRDRKTYTAIAKSHGIPVGTVRSRIHRARTKIASLRADPGRTNQSRDDAEVLQVEQRCSDNGTRCSKM